MNGKIYIVYDVDRHRFMRAFFEKRYAERWKVVHQELHGLHLAILTIDCQAEIDYLT